jgi:23S rRNA G2069 N7-methylase RlmK/C1962 C5-methylase RlmI
MATEQGGLLLGKGAEAPAIPSLDELFARLLSDAWQRRRDAGLISQTEMFRWIHDAGDGLPGVVVDLYGDAARVEFYDDAWQAPSRVLRDCLLDHPRVHSVILVFRDPRGKATSFQVSGKAVGGYRVLTEDGIRYALRLADPDALGTGIFMDHRAGRRRVRAASQGGRVLNLFAHAGAFGNAAWAGGAHRIDQVDAARKCAGWASMNLALNGADPRAHRFMVEDAFKVLRRQKPGKAPYRAVICDPPTTAISPGGKRFLARDHLSDMARMAALGLGEGGLLVLSTNDRHLTSQAILQACEAGIEAAGRSMRSIEALPLPADFPLPDDDERLRPAKGALATLS